LLGPGVRQLPPSTSSVYLADDDVIFEVTTARASDIGAPAARGEELLRRHMQWESSYTARMKGWSAVNAEGSAIKTLGDAAATMVWGYDFPQPSVVFDRKITRVLYSTAAVDDVVFALATPLEKGDRRDSHAIDVLRRVMRTLARESRPLDVFALSAELQAGGRWKGCPAAADQKDPGGPPRLRFSELELELPRPPWQEEPLEPSTSTDVLAVGAFSRTALTRGSPKRPGLVVVAQRVAAGVDTRAFFEARTAGAPAHRVDWSATGTRFGLSLGDAVFQRWIGDGPAAGLVTYLVCVVSKGVGYHLLLELHRLDDARMRGETRDLLRSLRIAP
jgi:hypothetical protein